MLVVAANVGFWVSVNVTLLVRPTVGANVGLLVGMAVRASSAVTVGATVVPSSDDDSSSSVVGFHVVGKKVLVGGAVSVGKKVVVSVGMKVVVGASVGVSSSRYLPFCFIGRPLLWSFEGVDVDPRSSRRSCNLGGCGTPPSLFLSLSLLLGSLFSLSLLRMLLCITVEADAKPFSVGFAT